MTGPQLSHPEPSPVRLIAVLDAWITLAKEHKDDHQPQDTQEHEHAD